MSERQQPLPSGGHQREAIALIEIEHTAISPATARILVAIFLAAIALVPVVELALARSLGDEGIAAAWSHLSRVPLEVRSYVVQVPDSTLWHRIVSANRIALVGLSGFERALENESFIGRTLRPPAQLLMTRWLGAGNERVYVGHDRWLFYRDDVEYITGRGFLDAIQLRRRVAAAPEFTAPPQPDPRPAILQFKDDLAARGITLVVMPTPLKPAVHPEKLARRYGDASAAVHNPSFGAFTDGLRREGVLIFDPSEALASARAGSPQYLATDTHWRPESMELAAELLGDFIRTHAGLPAVADPGYRVERVEIRNSGDAARMLDLPDNQSLYPQESAWIRRVLHSDGSAWRSARDSDVLVLGDSFTNIYALESLGWGTSAGLAEQLSYVLGRPVDRIVQNDEGAFATRALLQQNLDRLDGKRVVVYQFASRELAFGDWKEIRLPGALRRF